MRVINLLAALPVVALAGGCYASVGPTVGYKVGDGLTLGAEVDSGYWFVHGSVWFYVSTQIGTAIPIPTGFSY